MSKNIKSVCDISLDIQNFKNKYDCFKELETYKLFTLFCIKQFFYNDNTVSFDPDIVLNYLVDGPNDGGIDAIFNDPKSEENDVIVIQSKLYEKSTLDKVKVASETRKLIKAVNSIASGSVEGYSDKVKTACKNALNEKSNDGKLKVFFFTTYAPRFVRSAVAIRKAFAEACGDLEGKFVFYSDIVAQLRENETGKMVVESGSLEIESKDNILRYEDSVVANISAKSLQNLYITKGNVLLGLNLRYHVPNKKVDRDIEDSIHHEPENFWYKNNGIVIACENYSISDKVLSLNNFSIINGGQTTDRIGNIDVVDDFYLLCKIVKLKGNSQDDKLRFANNIAIATNEQKAIKPVDLKANTPEQQKLKERLSQIHVHYITKKVMTLLMGITNILK